MTNIKCQNLDIFSIKIRMKQIFTIIKPNIMKKSKYQQYFHCFIVCILVPNAFWFGCWQNILTIVISTAFRSVALITREALTRGRRLFQCGYSKVLIRGNMVLLGLEQLYLYCIFFILLYFSHHILLKYVNLKDNWEQKFAPSW